MSLYAAEQEHHPLPSPDDLPGGRTHPWWPWVWLTVTCLLMGASGTARVWQDSRFSAYQSVAVAPTFPLTELPETLGTWHVKPGGEKAIDPLVARIAGSTDSLMRTYTDETTGVVLDLLVIYGRTDTVSGHTPEVCYPAIGYQAVAEGETAQIPVGRPDPAAFRTSAFARRSDQRDRQEVYYSFRQLGRWTPDVESNWKALNADPSVFKVQVQRRVGSFERRHLANPTEQFLSVLLPELERKIGEASARGANKNGTPAPGTRPNANANPAPAQKPGG